jgi:hypothetical protein
MSNQITSVDPDKLIGLKANLYYTNELNRFQLGSVLFEAIEDESDGYRSYYSQLQIVNLNAEKKEGNLLGEVSLVKVTDGSDDGWAIVDSDGHTWVEFGTNNYDDYYPCFYFRVNPKEPNKN